MAFHFKGTLWKPIILLLISFVLSMGLYRFETAYDLKAVGSKNIKFKRETPKNRESIPINKGFKKGITFIMDVKTGETQADKKTKQGITYYNTLLDEENIRFIIADNGEMLLYWGLNDIFRESNSIVFNRGQFVQNKWNRVGFVFTRDENRAVLTTFMNGDVAWEREVPAKNPLLKIITLLPGEHPPKLGGPLKGEARNIFFFDRALKKKEIKNAYLFPNVNPLLLKLKIFLAFAIFLILGTFLWNIVKNSSLRDRFGFIFGVNVLFFILFNLGKSASVYLSRIPSHKAIAIYFFIMNTVFVLALFSYIIIRLTGMKSIRGINLSGVLGALLCLTCILSSFIRFEYIYPFFFNIIFALMLTLVLTAPDIVKGKIWGGLAWAKQ